MYVRLAPWLPPVTAGWVAGYVRYRPPATEAGAVNGQNATERISVLDSPPTTFELMKALATSVLNEHANDASCCVVRGSAWPCKRIVLAALGPYRHLT